MQKMKLTRKMSRKRMKKRKCGFGKVYKKIHECRQQ
jgi:hypothetical protein